MRLSLPAVRGVVDRRILLNFRVEPSALSAAIPEPFEPVTVDGWGVGGVCLIRFEHLRPRGLPAVLGLGSENAAHRIAVEWERDGERRRGVYVPRRDTSSRLFAAAGGRLFSDYHHHARFDVEEGGGRYDVTARADDGTVRVRVAGRVADSMPADSVFDSLEAASAFFERESVGMSDGGAGDGYYALEVRSDGWSVAPLDVEAAGSSYFEDRRRFPEGTVELDHALLMRDVAQEWREGEPLCVTA